MDNNLSLNDYWKRFLKNDKKAFSYIYENSVKDLFNYGKGLGYAPEICEDAIHDIFYKIYSIKDKLQNIENFRVYLFQSFRNRLFDIRKGYKDENSLEEFEHGSFYINVTILDSIVSEEEKILLKNKVESFLDKLTHRQREVVFLRYMREMSYDEISRLMNINVDSVRKLVYRSLETLRKQLSGVCLFF